MALGSPALAAAVPLCSRDEKKNNSQGFPSPPVLALCPGPAGSFISQRQRLFHLRLEVRVAALAAAGIGTWPDAAGTKWAVTRPALQGPACWEGGGERGPVTSVTSAVTSKVLRTPKIWLLPSACREIEALGFCLVFPANKTMLGLCQLSFTCIQTQLIFVNSCRCKTSPPGWGVGRGPSADEGGPQPYSLKEPSQLPCLTSSQTGGKLIIILANNPSVHGPATAFCWILVYW